MIGLDVRLERRPKATSDRKTAIGLFQRRRARAIVGGALLAAVGLLPSPALAQHVAAHRKFDTALDDAVDTPTVGASSIRRVIVRATPGASALIRKALIASGHHINSELNLIDGLAVDLSTDDLKALALNPLVVSLSSDAEVRATQVAATSVSTNGGGLLRTTLGLTDLSPQGQGVGLPSSTPALPYRRNSMPASQRSMISPMGASPQPLLTTMDTAPMWPG